MKQKPISCGKCCVLLESNAIQLIDSMNNGATPLIIATYLGQSSIVQALLSNDNIDLSRTFEDKTALQYSESHDQINEEGRLACQELFRSL